MLCAAVKRLRVLHAIQSIECSVQLSVSMVQVKQRRNYAIEGVIYEVACQIYLMENVAVEIE